MFFGPAYLLAAYAINNDSPFHVMLIAWVFVGAGSSSMYFAGVTTCAKNFTGNSRGIALALPIAAFGLSSLWESQLVSRVFTDKAGDLIIANVFTFFAGLLTIVGFLGGVGLTIVPTEEEEEETIVRDVESVSGERTGLLSGGSKPITYGAESVGPITRKKEGFLSEATMSFLKDKTMWWFAAGVFLVTGSGESFINNVGYFFSGGRLSLNSANDFPDGDPYPIPVHAKHIIYSR